MRWLAQTHLHTALLQAYKYYKQRVKFDKAMVNQIEEYQVLVPSGQAPNCRRAENGLPEPTGH